MERRRASDEPVRGRADQRHRGDCVRAEHPGQGHGHHSLQPLERSARRRRGSHCLLPRWRAEGRSRLRTGRQGSARAVGRREPEQRSREGPVPGYGAFRWLRCLRCSGGRVSRFVQTIRLSTGGAGNRVEFANVIDWKTGETALKATFPLAASNPEATYNRDVGTIQRGNNDPKKYEVPSHQWFDLTDRSGAYGVTVLSDCKYGSDKPDDSTLRLTLLYSPGLGEGNGKEYSDQTTQDWGHHEFVYGLAGHAGDWRREQTDWQAYRLNQPLFAFESPKHQGALGKSFSLLNLNNGRVRVLALKKAEESDEVIVRLVEIDGKPAQNVRVTFAAPVAAAREVNGQEMPLGAATVAKGELVTSLGPYQLRTFAVKLVPAPAKVAAPQSRPVTLSYDLSVASVDGTKSAGGFDAAGRSLPAEMLPSEIAYAGIHFSLAPAGSGKPNAVASRGQTISLPAGKFNRLYVLAASAEGDQKATFRIGRNPVELTIQDWGGYIGQWDNRLWNRVEVPVPPPSAPAGGAAGTQQQPPRPGLCWSIRALRRALSSARLWRGSPRIAIPPTALMSLMPILTCLPISSMCRRMPRR